MTGVQTCALPIYNLQRLGRIIATLDLPTATDVEVIALKHAIAIDLAPLLARLIESGNAALPVAAAGAPATADTQYKTTIIPEVRTNSLILRAANPARLAQVRTLVDKLDQPGSAAASGNLHVVYLKNADAIRLAATLRAAMQGQSGLAGAGTTGSGLTTASPLSGTTSPAIGTSTPLGSGMGSGLTTGQSATLANTGGQIQADPATNSLIITAPEPQYRQLRAVIDQLDGRRAQVLVESLIAEVDEIGRAHV